MENDIKIDSIGIKNDEDEVSYYAKINSIDLKLKDSNNTLLGNRALHNLFNNEKILKITNSIFESLRKLSDYFISNNIFEILEKICSLDISDMIINIYNNELYGKDDIIKLFYNEMIFPPINYLSHIQWKNIDVKNIVVNQEVKEYYYKQMDTWKDNINNKDDYGEKLIEEIRFSLKNKMYMVASLSMFTLIEYRMLKSGLKTLKNKNITYKERRQYLKRKVFTPIDSLNPLYKNFISDSLYQDTNNAIGISRHICHGVDLYKLNEKNAMSLVFMYDLFDTILSANNK